MSKANIEFTIFNSVFDTRVYETNKTSMQWENLIPLLMKPRVVTHKTDVKLISGCSFSGDTRNNQCVDMRHLLLLDFDDGTHYNWFISTYLEYEFVVYTSFSHSKELPKFRVVIPLEVPVDAIEFSNAKKTLLGIFPGVDEASFVSSQAFYVPSCTVENEHLFFSLHNVGKRWSADQSQLTHMETELNKAIASLSQPARSFGETSLVDAARVVMKIDADVDYQTWSKVGMALKGLFGEDAYEVYLEWSSGGSGFDGERVLDNKWRGFNDTSPYCMGFLVNTMKQNPAKGG